MRARLPVDAHASLTVLAAQLHAVQTMIGSIEKRIVAQHRSNEASKRLETIPGIGVIGATTIAAVVTDPKAFRSGRDFAAWVGIVPRQDSTGGKQKLGPISKQGDQYLRRILIVGAHSVLWRARQQPEKYPCSLSFSLGDRSRSSQSRWPTRWPGSPGRCWQGVARTGRPNLWRPDKELGNGRMRLRPCVHELQG